MNPNRYTRAFFARAWADLEFVAERMKLSEDEVKAMRAAMQNSYTRAAKMYRSIAASLRKDDETKVA